MPGDVMMRDANMLGRVLDDESLRQSGERNDVIAYNAEMRLQQIQGIESLCIRNGDNMHRKFRGLIVYQQIEGMSNEDAK